MQTILLAINQGAFLCIFCYQQSQRNPGHGHPNPGRGAGGRGDRVNTNDDNTSPDGNNCDHTRGSHNPGCGRPNRNHPDYVPTSVYNNMTPAQCNQLWQSRQTHQTHTTESSTSTSLPTTIQVNHQQGCDTQGTTATPASTGTTAEPGSVLQHMLSNNRARTSDASAMTTNQSDTGDTIVIN